MVGLELFSRFETNIWMQRGLPREFLLDIYDFSDEMCDRFPFYD